MRIKKAFYAFIICTGLSACTDGEVIYQDYKFLIKTHPLFSYVPNKEHDVYSYSGKNEYKINLCQYMNKEQRKMYGQDTYDSVNIDYGKCDMILLTFFPDPKQHNVDKKTPITIKFSYRHAMQTGKKIEDK